MVAVWPIKSREVTVARVIAVALHTAASVGAGEAGVGAMACAVGGGTLRGVGAAFQVQSHSIQTHRPQATHEGAPLKLCGSWEGRAGQGMGVEPETGMSIGVGKGAKGNELME